MTTLVLVMSDDSQEAFGPNDTLGEVMNAIQRNDVVRILVGNVNISTVPAKVMWEQTFTRTEIVPIRIPLDAPAPHKL